MSDAVVVGRGLVVHYLHYSQAVLSAQRATAACLVVLPRVTNIQAEY